MEEGLRRMRGLAALGLGLTVLFACCVMISDNSNWLGRKGNGGRIELLRGSGAEGGMDIRAAELRQAAQLKEIHDKFNKAEAHLEDLKRRSQMVSVELSNAASTASGLKKELKLKMRTIEQQFHLPAPDAAGSVAVKDSSEVLAGDAMRALSMKELNRRLEGLQHQEEKDQLRIRELETGRRAVTSGSLWDSDMGIDRFPRRPADLFRATRAMGSEGLSALQRLKQVTQEIEDENIKICELCGSSALLRINRQEICESCSGHNLKGDIDIAPLVTAAHTSRSSASGQDKDTEAVEKSDWDGGDEEGSEQASVEGDKVNSEVAKASMVSFLNSWDSQGGGSGLLSGSEGRRPYEPVRAGEKLLDSLGFNEPGGIGAVGRKHYDVYKQQGASGRASVSGLMQVDRGDSAQHIGINGYKGSLGAYMHAGRDKFLLGLCWPSQNELAYMTERGVCNLCKNKLGADVMSLGSAVSCEPYKPRW